jgi:hypothetical protein
MRELSTTLHNLARSHVKVEGELDYRSYRNYLWIWTWLLSNQPIQVIEKQLDAIEAVVKRETLAPQFILELAWKAEVLERLLEH